MKVTKITVQSAKPHHKEGGQLIYSAIDDMAKIILGKSSDNEIINDLQQLWKNRANRFSHDMSFVALEDNQVLGVITCNPLKQIDRAMTPTVLQIILMNKLKPFLSIISHPKSFYSLVTMDEGNEDEYHISMLATMPNARGKGVGQQLLNFAEQKAKESGFSKLSLTVVQDNDVALKLYQKMGFEIVGEINKKPYYLYQMRKEVK